MLSRLGPAAAIAALCGALSAANAQSVRDIPAPLETPPASFKGQQYVDGRGCVFIRAGIDDKTMWVPRVGADRKVLCGYPPTFGTVAAAEPSKPAPVELAAPVVEAAPVQVVAPTPQVTKPKPTTTQLADNTATEQHDSHLGYVDVPRTTGTPGQTACPDRAPYAERLPLRGGGTVLLCLSRPGLLDQQSVILGKVKTPAVDAETVLACPADAPVAQSIPQRAGGTALLCTAGDGRAANLAIPKAKPAPTRAMALDIPVPTPDPRLVEPIIPKGYALAWTDGRLNPYRGKGTAAGQLAQDRIWTKTVPARLVKYSPVQTVQPARTVTLSTKSPSAAEEIGGSYVQVGSFGQPANAKTAQANIAALGLPVAASRVIRSGKTIQIVFAGPFSDPAHAQNALTKLRRSGFPDAILKQ